MTGMQCMKRVFVWTRWWTVSRVWSVYLCGLAGGLSLVYEACICVDSLVDCLSCMKRVFVWSRWWSVSRVWSVYLCGLAGGVSRVWSVYLCGLAGGLSLAAGIWPSGADGTDVNACSVSHKLNLIATADDFGKVNLYKYPCSQPHVSFCLLTYCRWEN